MSILRSSVVEAALDEDDKPYDLTLRPTRLTEFVGQTRICDNLKVFVEAARGRKEPLDHILFCGPPGLGKTTMANILANELDVNLVTASGPAIDHKGQLAALLTKLGAHDVLFIDEIHRLNASVEESLYTAIEDFCIDVIHGEGAYASSLRLGLQPFTLVGATTRTGLLTSPLLSRFGYIARLDYYPAGDLAQIVQRSAQLLKQPISTDGAHEIAKRARGTPRIANRLLRRTRDFAQVLGKSKLDHAVVDDALTRLEVDALGLDDMDRRMLAFIIEHYKGGPVGVETLAAALGEPKDTLEDVYEPFLIQQGLLARTPRGRVATDLAYRHLQMPAPEGAKQIALS